MADDQHGWFPDGQRIPRIRSVFRDTLAYLAQCLGPDMAAWQWGRLHRLPLKHVLSMRGDLGQLLNHGDVPVNGDIVRSATLAAIPTGSRRAAPVID